ncbi:unnamed protein product [Medioppia subpectinata]|uniref:Uncharacterized protein n=1 Tax=Medioppia subpectinata TaxID=1979941 RepID=A0A7R9KG16_9ACAR|nr:unnamed protein product [Medioppia subpectinata]CAG2102880.1 unnamed protein product [Medioppia subpectinata]
MITITSPRDSNPMVGSRVSSRIAQRLIKRENTDITADDHNSGTTASTAAVDATPLERNPSASGGQELSPDTRHQRSSLSSSMDTTPKKYKRHTIITSSPSSVEEDDVFDGHSGAEDIIDDDDEEEEEDEDDDEEDVIVSTPLRQRRAAKRLNRMSRHQKRDGVLGEVDSARNKLDDLLAHISKGDSQEDDEFDDEDGETDSSPHLKRRRSQKHKKAGKGLKEDGFTKTSSFVLKLFDRSVDLAQFSHSSARDDAPLYPVCRSWIRNNTSLPNLYESPPLEEFKNEDPETSGGPIDEKPSGIYHLPKPLAKPRDESGREIDLRIPASVRDHQKRESQADVLINSLSEDTFAGLLARNMSHWKHVRQEWQQSSQENELRYKHSCDVLKSITMNGQTMEFKPQTMDLPIN